MGLATVEREAPLASPMTFTCRISFSGGLSHAHVKGTSSKISMLDSLYFWATMGQEQHTAREHQGQGSKSGGSISHRFRVSSLGFVL